jgi:small conductance mechanosensitive channel
MVEGLVGIVQSYFYQVVLGIVILLIGFGLGILVKKFLYRVLKEVEINKLMRKVGITLNVEKSVSSLASYLIYLITIVFFLDQLGITSIVLYLVVGAILMLLILTFLVGLKDVIPNFVAWLILQKRGRVYVGKRVSVKEISGVVEKVGYLETEIKTEGGDTLYVPNSLFMKSKFWLRP